MGKLSTKQAVWGGLIVGVLGLGVVVLSPDPGTQSTTVDNANVRNMSTIETKTEIVKKAIAFSVTENTDSLLPKGQRKVIATGVAGEKTETYEVTYDGGVQTNKRLVKSETTKAPVDEVVSIGTYVEPARSITPRYGSPAPASDGGGSASAYYKNCTAARNAGAAPIYRGQPGYRAALDRDNDGVACE